MSEKRYNVFHVPRWLFYMAAAVMGLLLVLAVANLSLNFLDSRARARYDAMLEERGKRLDGLERRVESLEGKR